MDNPNEPRTPRTRRRHSAEFKAQVLEEVAEPGSSIASVAQRHKLNANLVHKWLRTPPKDANKALTKPPAFIDVQPTMIPQTNHAAALVVDIPLRDDCVVKIHWPFSEAESLAHWLKAMMS